MDSLTRPYWPEPAGARGQIDGAMVTVTGELAYVMRQISGQGLAYMTGVLRAPGADGEMPFEVPPTVYRRCGGLLGEGETRTITARVDRRGEIHLLAVHDVAEGTGV